MVEGPELLDAQHMPKVRLSVPGTGDWVELVGPSDAPNAFPIPLWLMGRHDDIARLDIQHPLGISPDRARVVVSRAGCNLLPDLAKIARSPALPEISLR